MPTAGFPLKFKIQVVGGEKFVFALQRFAKEITDFTPFWNDYFVPTWYSMMAQQYASEGEATGARWAPLTAEYAAWKQKHWPGQPIGVLTGATRASLTSPFDSNAVLNISRRSFAVGTALDYPIYLQLGTSKMVARPPIRLTEQFVNRDVAKLLQRFGHDRMKAAGFGQKP